MLFFPASILNLKGDGFYPFSVNIVSIAQKEERRLMNMMIDRIRPAPLFELCVTRKATSIMIFSLGHDWPETFLLCRRKRVKVAVVFRALHFFPFHSDTMSKFTSACPRQLSSSFLREAKTAFQVCRPCPQQHRFFFRLARKGPGMRP